MKMTATLLALALSATSVSALTIEGGRLAEDFEEETAAFLGDTLYDVNGDVIGTVVEVEGLEPTSRRIGVRFTEGFSDQFSGMIFNLDALYESDGVLQSPQTGAEIRSVIEQHAAANPSAILPGDTLLD